MNIYLHFPFCRSKCAYCALHSRAGSSPEARRAYAERLAREINALPTSPPPHTIYFGGGSPALCPLAPILDALRAKGVLTPESECTVELHPLDATPETLESLHSHGVNRISLGVQSFDDTTLSILKRHHTAAEAVAAIHAIRSHFPSFGIDLITGLPSPPDLDAIADILPSLSHMSVYTLIREPKTLLDLEVRRGRITLPDDSTALAEFASMRELLVSNGFSRYEISNFARTGFECRHNFAVWRGEDYIGLGDGACGRQGLVRTTGKGGSYESETLTPEADALERAIFSLRTSDGLSPTRAAARWPILAPRMEAWTRALDFHASQGLLARDGSTYRLTPRGAEVCDSILADLVP